MGRPRKDNIVDAMEQQIEKAQAKVIKYIDIGIYYVYTNIISISVVYTFRRRKNDKYDGKQKGTHIHFRDSHKEVGQ